MKRLGIMGIVCILLGIWGCTSLEKAPTGQTESNFMGMEEEAQLSYEVPVSTPGIIVDQLGYRIQSTKVVIFQGREIPGSFQVIEEKSGKTVFTGTTENQEWNQAAGEYNGYGDFTELKTPGVYYIEAPLLGRSYSFSIGEDIYDGLFAQACKQYYYNRCGMTLTEEYAGEGAHNACHTGKALLREDSSVSLTVIGGWHQDEKGQKDVCQAARSMATMLLSYELFGEAFTDDMGIPESGNGVPDILDEIRYEVEWLLKMQDTQTGAVYAGMTVYQPEGGMPGKTADVYVEPASYEAEMAFAMALAKFSYLYQSYDTAYATGCLKAADRAFSHGILTKNTGQDCYRFAAAAELYRASGEQSYHRYISEYHQGEREQEALPEVILLGSVTYLSTTQSVNVALCEDMMEELMERAEQISGEAKETAFLTAGSGKKEEHGELLLDMMYLTVADHVIANHEYETVIEDHLHYFLGRNELSVCYLDDVGTNSYKNRDDGPGIMKQFDADSKLIFMLSEVVCAR